MSKQRKPRAAPAGFTPERFEKLSVAVYLDDPEPLPPEERRRAWELLHKWLPLWLAHQERKRASLVP
jgi:hypothetical protein